MANPLCFGQFFFIMNKDTWNSIPSDLQATIDQVGKEVSDTEVEKVMTGLPQIWEDIKSKGVDVYSVSDDEIAKWRALTKGIAEEYVKSKAGSGFPVKEAYDLLEKVVADYTKK